MGSWRQWPTISEDFSRRSSPPRSNFRILYALIAAGLLIGVCGGTLWHLTNGSQVDSTSVDPRYDEVQAALNVPGTEAPDVVEALLEKRDPDQAVLMLEYLQLADPENAVAYQRQIIMAWREAGDVRAEWPRFKFYG